LTDVKNLASHGISVTQVAQQVKQHLALKIEKEIDVVEGFQHVFQAMFKRETQQALNNQRQMGLPNMREDEQTEMNQMRVFYQNELVKRANLLQILLYVMETDFIRLV
jgi:hypothetical protein